MACAVRAPCGLCSMNPNALAAVNRGLMRGMHMRQAPCVNQNAFQGFNHYRHVPPQWHTPRSSPLQCGVQKREYRAFT